MRRGSRPPPAPVARTVPSTVTVPGGALMIEWRADDHVIMTGPAEWEFSGTFDPATGDWARDTEQDVA